jgi:hypothetical protein
MCEPGVESKFGGATLYWKPQELPGEESAIFNTPIALPRIGVNSDGYVEDVTFNVDGDELTLQLDSLGFLGDDPLAHDILEEFSAVYDTHRHVLCYRALRLNRMRRRQMAQKKIQSRAEQMQKNIDDMYATGKIRVRTS